jgi:hypothetical protein
MTQDQAGWRKSVSWWTPTGWIWAPEPEEWRGGYFGAQGSVDDWFREHGYRRRTEHGRPETNRWVINIWSRPEHLFVWLWNSDGEEICRFFVVEANRAPFMVDKLPRLLRELRLDDDQDHAAEWARRRREAKP